MKLLSVVGRGASDVADDIAHRLGATGTVARIDCSGNNLTEEGTESPSVPRTTVRFDAGGWHAHGTDRTLEEVLDDLTPRHDYAIISGRPDLELPTIRVGNVSSAGDVLMDVTEADGVDFEQLQATIPSIEDYETLQSLITQVTESDREEYAGAIATFTGRVRAKDTPDDARTIHLEYEKYDGVAEERMTTIEDELAARDGVEAVAVHHRSGIVEAGEPSVFIVILAGHRPEAFDAVEDGINRLKDEVPIFKKEVTVQGDEWAHARTSDV